MFDDYTRLTDGQSCPVTSLELITGETSGLIGTDQPMPFMINFFISKCPHCRKAIRFITSEIWNNTGDRMRFVSVGRDHSREEIAELRKIKRWSFPLAADPDRSIYEQFAERKVPRTYLFNSAGELIHQVRGFNQEEYMELKEIVMELVGDSETRSE